MKLMSFSILFFFLISCKKEKVEILDEPTIYNFYNKADTVGAELIIVGKNFSSKHQNNIIGFQGVQTTSYYSTNDTIKVKIPDGAQTGIISLRVYSKETQSKDTLFIITGKYTRMKPMPIGRINAFSFNIDGKGYIGTGTGSNRLDDLWEYNPNLDSWEKKNPFPGGKRRETFCFVINGKAYIGGGTNTEDYSSSKEFYEYNPADNSWIRKADFPRVNYSNNTVGLSLNNKGYVITGEFSKQVWEYNPLNNTWVMKKDFPGLSRSSASGFVINDKIYIGLGNHGGNPRLYDLWEYEPLQDTWIQKASLPEYLGHNAVGFSIGNKGYFANGNNHSFMVWEYNAEKNNWIYKLDFPGESVGYASAFTINGSAYILGGAGHNKSSDENWKFTP